jgi:hypothetical protein
MKYKTVTIKPEGHKNKAKWVSRFWEIAGDREELTKLEPHPMGFFHYPETMSDEEAFVSLKDKMIKAHRKEIDSLQKSLTKLILLKFKKD